MDSISRSSQGLLSRAYESGLRCSEDGTVKKLSILHVEDDKVISTCAKRAAERANRQYISFVSGEEALQYIEENSFDVVIMDIDLSKGGGRWNGYETARKIRKLFPYQLIYSASSDAVVDNPIVDGVLLFNGHLGKAGICFFINDGIEKAVSENRIVKM